MQSQAEFRPPGVNLEGILRVKRVPDPRKVTWHRDASASHLLFNPNISSCGNFDVIT
jgi:hypothetical protein